MTVLKPAPKNPKDRLVCALRAENMPHGGLLQSEDMNIIVVGADNDGELVYLGEVKGSLILQNPTAAKQAIERIRLGK